MDTLSEKIKTLTGHKRTFLLMRIAGLDAELGKQLTGIKRGTYNSWFKHEEFSVLYHQLPDLAQEYRRDAVQLLRKDNQLEAVLLEASIIRKMKEEVEGGGELVICKTNLAREVYSKLMENMDGTPKIQSQTWQQRIDRLQVYPNYIEGGKAIDGEFEEVDSEQTEHPKSLITQKVPSPNDETTKEAPEERF